jgi:lysophospholipase L1-like esterase
MSMPCFAAEKDGQWRNDALRRERLNDIAQDVVARVRGAEFVDLTPFTCDEGDGISRERSKALYVDGVHWSPQGGRAVWALLLERMRADGVVGRS